MRKSKTVTLAKTAGGEKVIKITFSYDVETLHKVRGLPRRRYHKNSRSWSVPISESTIQKLISWKFTLSDTLAQYITMMRCEQTEIIESGIPGLKGEPYPFQMEGIALIESYGGRVLLADEMGLGKTIQTLGWLQMHPRKRPVIIVVPAYLKLNWKKELEKWLPNPKVTLLKGKTPHKLHDPEIVIINYDILHSWNSALRKLNPEVLVTDECFPAGTKISTPNGEKNIENLSIGDEVYNAIGIGTVQQIGKRKVTQTVKLHLSNGKSIETTENHPFFTNEGWMSAENLKGKFLFAKSNIYKDRNKERQKEIKFSKNVRVERVEIQKRPNNKQSSKCTVYNLQVSKHPSYFTEGFLVHNCYYYKSDRAKRTKAVKALAKGIPHIIALSGAPIENRPIEIYNASKIIQPDIFPNKWRFAKRYCDARYDGFGWNFSGASHISELHMILKTSIMIRRKKKDVLKDLPAKTWAFVPIELNNIKEYNKAERDFISWVAENKGEEAADKVSNVQAIASIETLKQLAVRGKLDGAIDWIKDFILSGKKLVTFATHRFVIDELMKEFGQQAVKIDGRVSMQNRDKAVDAFQNDPDVKLFIGNIEAAGLGITLTAASDVAFLELPWTPGKLEQASDRVHRIGQTDKVTVYYLLAGDTIEEKIAHIIDHKRKVLDKVLDGKDTEQESLLTELIKQFES